jgi:hypothetical protein
METKSSIEMLINPYTYGTVVLGVKCFLFFSLLGFESVSAQKNIVQVTISILAETRFSSSELSNFIL